MYPSTEGFTAGWCMSDWVQQKLIYPSQHPNGCSTSIASIFFFQSDMIDIVPTVSQVVGVTWGVDVKRSLSPILTILTLRKQIRSLNTNTWVCESRCNSHHQFKWCGTHSSSSTPTAISRQARRRHAYAAVVVRCLMSILDR
ncbi:hypothetical protein J6590_054404 [Homalodisca vitripennis]|nr:hypothetical protein J6590_054404 [Homalodisca vitripennis]